MQKLLIILIFILPGFSVIVSKNSTDSLFLILDKTILEKSKFSEVREHKIDSLYNMINNEADISKLYRIYQDLFKEYRHYNMNSALSIAEKKLLIAKELKDQQFIYFSKMNIAEILGIMGMYKESLDITNNIERNKLDAQYWPYYYHLYHSLYSLMSANSLSQKEKENYDRLISLYKDSILQVLDNNTMGYKLVRNGKLLEQGRYDEALHLMKKVFEENLNDESLMGTIAFSLSEVFEKKGDLQNQKKFLAVSAISDLKKGVKGYIALRKLAAILFKEGDIERAYNYIKCSMEDATFCKARFRMLEISETLPIITAAYDKKIKEENKKLLNYMILISILSIILAASIFIISRQMKKLSKAQRSNRQMYEEMRQLNNDLEELNKKLSESNHVKEEYIGSVFNLCSGYINKIEKLRKNVNQSLINNKIDEVKRATSQTILPEEIKELFGLFDTIFLNLYPNFINEFNLLLNDEAKIKPKSGDILTPELRVFALIRLGITDSSKIAGFLHYSPQTVYNYKLKIHNKLIVSKEEFVSAMQEIGK